MYPDIVKGSGMLPHTGGYRLRGMTFTKMSPEEAYSLNHNLHIGTVRTSAEVILPGI
jgi:hypothetical protein